MEFLIKSILGGIIIATVSIVSKKSPIIGAFLLGIPITSLASLIFMYHSQVDSETLRIFSYHTIYFVVVSLTFFFLFAWMIPYTNFWVALLLSSAISGFIMLLAMYILNFI